MQREISIRAYAKINLALDVVGLRDDGYHRLETLMQKTGLADDIRILWQESDAEEFKIKLRPGKPYLPAGEKNLAYRAAMMMAERAGARGELDIDIKKRIPVAAGLGGGSADAAAVLVALNRLWNLKMNTWQLCAIGRELGADVPFLVLTHNTAYRCALCEETGEKMTAIYRGLQKHIVLAKPAFGVSTKEVFAGIDSCEITKRPDIPQLILGLKYANEKKILSSMANVLEEYTITHYAEVAKLKAKMESTEGARRVLMSGSGPTVFAIYDTYIDARQACRTLRKQGYEAYWTQTIRDTQIGGKKDAEF